MAMIEATTTVIKVEGQSVWLAGSQANGCGSCWQKSGCSVTAFESLYGKRTVQASSPFPLQAGDVVLIEIDGNQLLRGAVLLYLLPLLGMFSSVLLADKFVLPKDLPMRDIWLTASAVMGLLYSFIGVKRYKHGHTQPVVVRKVS